MGARDMGAVFEYRIDGNTSGLLTSEQNAAKGIRTPVVGVKGRHDWPLHYSSMHSVPYNFDTAR